MSGEEVKDVQLFRAACQSHFEKIAKSVSEERFTELFKEGGVTRSQCRKLYKQFHTIVVEGLNGQIDEMITEEKLPEKFAARQALLEAQKEYEGTTAWRPSGEPLLDLRSHDMHSLRQMKSALESYLAERKANVDGLYEKVRLARKSAINVQNSIESLNRKITEDDTLLDKTSEQYLKTLSLNT